MPQWIPSLWFFFFAISATKFSVARKVEKKGEHCTYFALITLTLQKCDYFWQLLLGMQGLWVKKIKVCGLHV
jgi:hypothetical protein